MRSSALSSVGTSSADRKSLTGDLATARIVVAGGRGLGGQESFQSMVALAELLEAQVGGTRGALDAGWIPHAREIGLSGARVAPELYLGFGLSGTNFHTIGMEHADYIVGINPNPKARIHELAHCSVLEDAAVCIRQLSDYLLQLAQSQSHFDAVTAVKSYFLHMEEVDRARYRINGPH